LYFVQREPDKPGVGFLYQIPLLGGTPHKLVEDVDSAVSFSPDGQQMVYLRNSSSEASSKLILAHADGSGEHVLASLPLPGYSDPAWSIDGKSIAAAVLDPGSQSPGRIVVLNPANGKEKTVYEGTALLQKPTWMPDGRHLVLIFHDISSDWNGQIGAISLGGQKLHRITNDLSVYSNSTLGVTRDGEQLVAIQVTPQAGVYTLSSDASSNSSATEVDNHGNIGVGWLPDGRLLTMDYDSHIAVMNADGGNRNVIYKERLLMGGLSVCPDGAHALFFMPNKQTKGINIWRLDVQNGSATVLTNGKVDQNAVCSPDSKYFLYTSLQKGKQVLMEMPLTGGEAKQLSDKFVSFAAISPDGKQIAALIAVGAGVNTKARIEIIPSQGGLPVKGFAPSPFISTPFRYSADGQSLYYGVTNKGVSNLVAQPIGVESASLVTNFNDLLIYAFDYDWKNKKLAVARGRSNDDVVLLTQQQAQ
jgi:Tol biopolymer transport system component